MYTYYLAYIIAYTRAHAHTLTCIHKCALNGMFTVGNRMAGDAHKKPEE